MQNNLAKLRADLRSLRYEGNFAAAALREGQVCRHYVVY